MTKTQYIKTMEKLEKQFQETWIDIVQVTNEYVETNENTNMPALHENGKNTIESLADFMVQSGAWLYDRINGKSTYLAGQNYRTSMTKKVNKILGYNQ